MTGAPVAFAPESLRSHCANTASVSAETLPRTCLASKRVKSTPCHAVSARFKVPAVMDTMLRRVVVVRSAPESTTKLAASVTLAAEPRMLVTCLIGPSEPEYQAGISRSMKATEVCDFGSRRGTLIRGKGTRGRLGICSMESALGLPPSKKLRRAAARALTRALFANSTLSWSGGTPRASFPCSSSSYCWSLMAFSSGLRFFICRCQAGIGTPWCNWT